MKKTKIQYIGRRLIRGKLFEIFLHRGEEVAFARHKWGRVGSWYSAREKGKDGLEKDLQAAEVEGPEASAEQVSTWEAQDRLAFTEMKRRRAREKLRKTPQLFEPLKAFLPAYRKLSWQERLQLPNAIQEWFEENEGKK